MIETITLSPKTPKAQRLIDRYGKQWNVINRLPTVRCLGGRSGILIQSLNQNHQQWLVIPDTEDRDFAIVD